MLFHFWKAFNSDTFDGRMLEFLAELSEIHVDPMVSNPQKIMDLPDDARSEGEGRPAWAKEPDHEGPWSGIFKDAGIFSEEEWEYIMCKCLMAMGGFNKNK